MYINLYYKRVSDYNKSFLTKEIIMVYKSLNFDYIEILGGVLNYIVLIIINKNFNIRIY